MAEAYDAGVARIYDLIVYGRDRVECEGEELEFLLGVLAGAPRPVRDVLDVGCGTGRHLVPLARAGFALTALDNSPGMIEECRRRLDRHGLAAETLCADMETMDFRAAFDAVLGMDSVICYLPTPERIVATLRRFRRALRPGGLLALDNHNFLALWEEFGETYWNTVDDEGIRVDYRGRCWFDDFPAVCHLEIVASVAEAGRTYEVANEEVHKVMTADEVTAYLRMAGFVDIDVLPDYVPGEEPVLSADRLIFLARNPGERERDDDGPE